jgi:alkylation response protein AidB-like acyl-CoA dehydrogenase
MNFAAARADLAAWKSASPADPYGADAPLRALLARDLPADRLAALAQEATTFGRAVVEVIAPAAQRYERAGHTPELVRWDGLGQRIEAVEFDPAYHDAGGPTWASGVVAHSGTPGRAYEQATLLYLLSLEGEAGHGCPATCTIGLARALRRRAEPEVRDRFLPPLLERDYSRAERGSQFLTEVQGGSDVGANATKSEPNGDGSYRITGEKWFCSVADAQQFLVTARLPGSAPGTRGLGCFVLPRMLDGVPNGFALRRLKDKLGTRGLASGEIDFDAAVAWPIGPIEDGFKTAVGIVLNTSRWMTAVGGAGMMRRAYLEASAYATHRKAFGNPIAAFPAVRKTIAEMRAAWLGALHLVFALTALEDRIDAGTASENDVLEHRFLVNATKYSVSIQATEVVRDGIEVLGGNGTIEDFSVLPRLYRDAMVYESWEGTHNVLAAQVLTDLGRLPILSVIEERVAKIHARSTLPIVDELATLWQTALADASRAVADTDYGAWCFREILNRITELYTCAHLLDAGESVAAEHLLRTRISAGADPGLTKRVDALVSVAAVSER